MRIIAILALAGLPGVADAAGVVATRTLPAGTTIDAGDLVLSASARGGINDPAQAIGLQTRITIYEGRPVQATALRAARLIERNQIVRVVFNQGGLSIATEGRALAPGAAGDLIRVMNTASRSTITARVNPDGTLSVAN